jgi:acetoin utilization deacetylase AcuC-like enzyme
LAQQIETYSAPGSRALSPLIIDVGVSLPTDNLGLSMEFGDTNFSKLHNDFAYRHSWRNYFRETIFPRICTFQPNLILISAGFDAHRKDSINAGYISLGEDDFAWVTDQLTQIAERYAEGRIVSVLEGGYQIGGEYSSAFARSVSAHVEALYRASKSRREFSLESSALDKSLESKVTF